MITLDSGETIKKVLRKGKLVFIGELIFISLLALIPIFLYISNALDTLVASNPDKVGYLLLFFYGVWLLICWIFMFGSWVEYYLGAWIITDARVMTTRHLGIFKRELVGVRYDRIKEVTLGLNGTVKIFTTTEEIPFVILNVRHPEAIKELIMFEQKKAYTRLKDVLSIDEVEMGMVY